ncbi:uncharacterized protein LOC107043272 [Diachasma alloeum]|uniref:uncharacterized protein LOC107043272 n=1 Tax=Diachasma alloeum TaxID=454923 RepID=UPI0007381BC2|nr:uncharacterized protein LOC107043272 [Diachasma alloeum]
MEVDAEPDLEQQCDDAVFELCDTRERYPQKCAEELAKTLRLTTQINKAPVIMKPSGPLRPLEITDEQRELFQSIIPITKDRADDQKALKTDLETMLKTVKDLKTVVEQVRSTEDCTIDNILKKTDKDQH